MKTLKYTLVLFAILFTLPALNAQETLAKLTEAEKEYASKNLDNTRFALQQAIGEINRSIGKDILEILPKKLNDIDYKASEDNVTGAAGFAGLFVHRAYGAEPKNGSLEIMSDSPMLTTLNALLSMPAMMTGNDPNQKRLKIGGYKSLLNKSTDDKGEISWDLQIPMSNTLVTLHLKGFPNESDVVALGNSLPLDQIGKLAR
jgi:hypothetical protein